MKNSKAVSFHKKLLSEYDKKKNDIKNRLKEFSEKNSEKERFIELCFCICTPQSQAKKVAEIINLENFDFLISSSQKDLEEKLRTKTRFHKNKAKYIISARKHIKHISFLQSDTIEAREWLVKNIKGLGYKEASHFLRNIGYRNLCIIDRHVINLMNEAKVFKSKIPPKNTKEYLDMELKIKNFAKKLNIDVDELDLLLWSMRTGFIFK
ncbi:MAG: N-glycosylase/DNA lyase [Candidatus Woesearchaeota archaeon]